MKKGLAVVLVLLAAAGFVGYRMIASHVAVDDDARAVVQLALAGEYAAATLDDGDAGFLEKAEQLFDLRKVRIVSADGRGDERRMMVRVDVRVGEDSPPDGSPVRYFRLVRGELGWRIDEPVTGWDYFVALFGSV